ncbi:MAG: SDR family oxidoreductase, partial [Candidatus Dormibacteraceae bacterium]
MIRDALSQKTICITGATGFLGKSVMEKILRDIPDVDRVVIAIRSSARRPAAERLQREILSSPAFNRLRNELGEERFRALAEEKLAVLDLDLDKDGLGLTGEGRELLARCDVVIHSAAAVEFDNPADLSAQTNLWGAARLVETIRRRGSRPHLVHVSTAYVG